MSTIPEREVVHPLEQELEISFREHYQMLYRTAYGILKNQADAEDVPQTIFLRLLRGGVPADFAENAKRYLYRAAVNLSLDVIRVGLLPVVLLPLGVALGIPIHKTLQVRFYRRLGHLSTGRH